MIKIKRDKIMSDKFKIERIVSDIKARIQAEYIEFLGQEVIQSTGLKPEDIELHQQIQGTEIKWWFEPKVERIVKKQLRDAFIKGFLISDETFCNELNQTIEQHEDREFVEEVFQSYLNSEIDERGELKNNQKIKSGG